MRSIDLFISVLCLATGCSDRPDSAPQSLAKGTRDACEITYNTIDDLPHVNYWAAHGAQLSAIAHLEVFKGFAPGLTFEEAERRYGEPTTIRTLSNLTELRCYRRETASLGVGKELYFSNWPGYSEPGVKWTVWLFPNEGAFELSSLVASNVLDQIRLPVPPYELVLRDDTAQQGSLWIKVEQEGATELRWVNSDSNQADE